MHDLTEDQRTALVAIAQSKTFWDGFGKNTFVANPMRVLQAFALPCRPNELRTFLGLPVHDAFDSQPPRAALFSRLITLVSKVFRRGGVRPG